MRVTAQDFDLAIRAHFGSQPGRVGNPGWIDINGWNDFTTRIQLKKKIFLPIGSVEVLERTDYGIVFRLNTETGQQFFLATVYLAEMLNPNPPPKHMHIWVGNIVELFPV